MNQRNFWYALGSIAGLVFLVWFYFWFDDFTAPRPLKNSDEKEKKIEFFKSAVGYLEKSSTDLGKMRDSLQTERREVSTTEAAALKAKIDSLDWALSDMATAMNNLKQLLKYLEKMEANEYSYTTPETPVTPPEQIPGKESVLCQSLFSDLPIKENLPFGKDYSDDERQKIQNYYDSRVDFFPELKRQFKEWERLRGDSDAFPTFPKFVSYLRSYLSCLKGELLYIKMEIRDGTLEPNVHSMATDAEKGPKREADCYLRRIAGLKGIRLKPI